MQPIRWESKTLYLLDQTALPTVTREIICRDPLQAAQAIRSMQVRGAPAIGVTAAFGMALAALSLTPEILAQEVEERMRETALILQSARPTAVNLAWAVQRMLRVAEAMHFSPQTIGTAMEEESIRIMEEDVATNRMIGQHGSTLIDKWDCVLTYCNTGSLATAGYGTALGVIRAAHDSGKEYPLWHAKRGLSCKERGSPPTS